MRSIRETRMRWLGIVLPLLMSVAGWALPASSQQSQSTTPLIPINIAWQPDPNAALYVAEKLGYFQQVGLAPNLLKFLAGPPMFAALGSGSVDVADLGLPPTLIGFSQGIDLQVVMIVFDISSTNVLVAKPGVKSVTDLRGKKVAAPKGSTTYYGLIKALLANRMTLADIKYLDMAPPITIPAFEHGDVDAVYIWSPWQNQLVQKGGVRITDNSKVGAFAPDLWAVRREWAEKNPEALGRFIRAMDMGLRTVREKPDLAIQLVSEKLSISREMATEIVQQIVYPTLTEQVSPDYVLSLTKGFPAGDAGVTKVLKEGGAFLKEQGLIPTVPQMDRLINPVPAQTYVKQTYGK